MNESNGDHFPKVRLASIASVVRGSSPRPAGDPRYFSGTFLPWITVADVTCNEDPILDSTSSYLTKEGSQLTRIFEPGTVLLSNSGATLGVPKITGIRAGANDGVAGFLNLSLDVDPCYLYYSLFALTDYLRKEVASGVGQPNLNTELIGNVYISMPTLPEQKAIAAVLSTWDRGIRQLTDLIAAKLRFKQGLMQQLLTGQRRFKGFGKPSNDTGQLPEGWKRLKASELFENFTQKKNDNEDLLSVTQDRGVIPRTMLKGKVVMPESGTGGYKLVEPGNFVISLRSFQGGLEYSQYRGLVSPAYTVLKPCQTINEAFFRHYFKSYDFIQRLAVAVIGIRDGKQISYNDFESVKLPKPPIEEQERIAAVLDISDKEVDLLRKQLDSLKQQKKGLMQKLLTGEVRVKLPKGVV